MRINFFSTTINSSAQKKVNLILKKGKISSGQQSESFESSFSNTFNIKNCSAVNSGTSALHLALSCAGVKTGDEVILPAQTFLATAMVVLYQNAKLVFADIQKNTGNICPLSIKKKITAKTKAIIVVHWGGYPCDMLEIRKIAKEKKILVIEDAAHAIGAYYRNQPIGSISDFTCFSFQAIKHLTTGDGGLLTFLDAKDEGLAKRLRWFGIDRQDKQNGIWDNDIKEIGYKYQMTDLGAAIGLAGLEEFDQTLKHRQELYKRSVSNLKDCIDVSIVDDFDPKKTHAAWLFTILVKNREDLQKKLRLNGIESGQTHYRNDRYSIFNCDEIFCNMDLLDNDYLILPLHTKMSIDDVDYICSVIQSGW
jgi:perosamine synthetase